MPNILSHWFVHPGVDGKSLMGLKILSTDDLPRLPRFLFTVVTTMANFRRCGVVRDLIAYSDISLNILHPVIRLITAHYLLSWHTAILWPGPIKLGFSVSSGVSLWCP